MEYKFLGNIQANLVPWVSLIFAIILNGLYLSARKYLPETAGGEYLVLTFTTIVCFHSLYLKLLPVNIRPWLFVIISFIIAFFPFRLSMQKQVNRFYIPIVGILLILATEYLAMTSTLFFNSTVSIESFIVSFSACVGIWAVNINVCDKFAKQNEYGGILLAIAHLLAILGLWRLTSNINSLAVSASWLSYAICVMVFSYKRKDVVMARSALFILILAAGKTLLIDAAAAASIVRILCLLLTGLVLYGGGLLIRKTNEWRKH